MLHSSAWLLLPALCLQAKEKVSVTHEEAERLRIGMKDFDHALLYDLKPAFGISDKQLDGYVYNGKSHSTKYSALAPPI